MSGRLSNLSFNRVDWSVREQILAALPDRIEPMLCELRLAEATDEDRRLVERFGDDDPLVALHLLRAGLCVDRQRFARKACQMYEQDPDLVRSKLEELAFVAGERRMGGELWVVNPDIALACFEPRFARARSDYVGKHVDDAPPFVETEGHAALARAMGGLAPDLEPLDQSYAPSVAAEIAAALEQLPAAFDAPARIRYMAEKLEGWQSEDLGSVEEHALRVAGYIRGMYQQARAGAFGVDVAWHTNP